MLDVREFTQSKLDFSIAGVDLRMTAPPDVALVLGATMSRVSRAPESEPSVWVSARRGDDDWEVLESSGSRKMLDSKSTATQVAGALVSSAIAGVASARALRTVRATVVEFEGKALAMIGSDWESTVTIASHLHTRGWRYICGDHALYDPSTNEIFPFEKSLFITSSSLAHLPMGYRGAIEASPWCVTKHGISFYAVDPEMVRGKATWADATKLQAVLLVDGRADDLPSIESYGPGDETDERFARLGSASGRHRAELTIGSYVETSDLVERWFASLDL